MKILYAEDERVTRALLNRSLINWGHEVILASSGTEAWKILKGEAPPKLVILDWMMPGISGVEVCRRLKAFESKVPFYVILLTSLDDKKDIVEGLDAGADDYITKPFGNNELRSRIDVGCRIIELQTKLLEKEKYDGVIEMAGAVCHELNQPIMTASGYLELLLIDSEAADPFYEKMNIIKEEIDRIGNITKKLMNIVRYETKDYLGENIIDIDKSTEELSEQNQIHISDQQTGSRHVANTKVNDLNTQVTTPKRRPIKSILFVDDEERLCKLFKEALEKFGYEVRVALNGNEGMKLLREKPADLIVTDIFMPEKDGHTFINEVIQEFSKSHIFAITGKKTTLGIDMELDVAQQLGAEQVFTKPLKIANLLKEIQTLWIDVKDQGNGFIVLAEESDIVLNTN